LTASTTSLAVRAAASRASSARSTTLSRAPWRVSASCCREGRGSAGTGGRAEAEGATDETSLSVCWAESPPPSWSWDALLRSFARWRARAFLEGVAGVVVAGAGAASSSLDESAWSSATAGASASGQQGDPA